MIDIDNFNLFYNVFKQAKTEKEKDLSFIFFILPKHIKILSLFRETRSVNVSPVFGKKKKLPVY